MLIDEWRTVLRKAWSVRLMLLAALLGALDTAMPFIAPEHASLRFAGLASAVSLAAAVARIVAQPKMGGDDAA